MQYYTKTNHNEILKLWEAMSWEQRNREREMGEIPEGADPEMEEELHGLNDEQWSRRIDFEKGCACHINPPCWNCIEYSELFPEEY